ncbi:hypothetical protein [Pseudomonas guariconensis]|uniref:hypothetical protein n=1 Tax=Pseudomonas guariconensis TaxID=1288410 RepID=UPI002B051C40|nr:hypothetical protein [Pseudomonas guariconensis]
MSRHDNRHGSHDHLEHLLQAFAQRYIRKTFTSRFMHEAAKRPQHLHTRVCHTPEQLFEDRFKGPPASLPGTGEFVALENAGFWIGTWERCEVNLLVAQGGLVIAQGGAWFWARSEPTRHLPGGEYHGMAQR